MSNDPLPFSELPASPNEAEYEAFYAELTATEPGPGFVVESTSRNLDPDTRALVDPISRRGPAMRDDAPPTLAVLLRGLVDLAAAIRQGEAAVSTARTFAAEELFAVERIHDVAMALRRREVEPALCDALEAATREIGDAMVRNNAAAAGRPSTAALLRELAERVNAMLALAAAMAEFGAGPVAGEGTRRGDATAAPNAAADSVEARGALAEEPGGAGEPAQRELGAETMVLEPLVNWVVPADSLTETTPSQDLPSVVVTAEAPSNELADDSAHRATSAAAPKTGEASPGVKLPNEHSAGQALPNAFTSLDATPTGAADAPHAAAPAVAVASVDAEVPASEPPPGDEVARHARSVPLDETAGEAVQEPLSAAAGERASEDNEIDALLHPIRPPDQLPDPWASIGPHEDPGDLFASEPPPIPSVPLGPTPGELPAPGAAKVEPTSARDGEAANPGSPAEPQEPVVTVPPPRAVMDNAPATLPSSPIDRTKAPEQLPPHVVPTDPLAAVLALTEDELVALCS